jgi:hypothetical protein
MAEKSKEKSIAQTQVSREKAQNQRKSERKKQGGQIQDKHAGQEDGGFTD